MEPKENCAINFFAELVETTPSNPTRPIIENTRNETDIQEAQDWSEN